eukprot:CAMPEP_0119183536 /NCGR_PEP_ID=MMETSP1315-20130426/64387_1 /TAXON_ID=676789 /ORGANISM="Prasinoderma singularis, Strain RCC927" /LENGTH=394 /DNA_ID=CAMNT_0007177917 /DNA_START=29 /DNA_END=1213 /DNA_ORIENTATION=+
MPAKAAAGGAAAADAEPRKAEPKTAEKSSERGAAAEKEKEKAPEAAAGAADGDSNKAAPPDIAAIIAQKAMEGVLAQPAVAVGGTTGCGMQDAAAALAAQAEAAALAERQASAIAPPPSGRAGLKLDRSANRPTGSRRLRWSVAEEQALRDGIAKFGLGKWRAIQKDPNFGPILTIRSNVDLKDKWRNLCKEEAKVAKVAQIGDQRKAADKAASAAASAGADGNAYAAAAPTGGSAAAPVAAPATVAKPAAAAAADVKAAGGADEATGDGRHRDAGAGGSPAGKLGDEQTFFGDGVKTRMLSGAAVIAIAASGAFGPEHEKATLMCVRLAGAGRAGWEAAMQAKSPSADGGAASAGNDAQNDSKLGKRERSPEGADGASPVAPEAKRAATATEA